MKSFLLFVLYFFFVNCAYSQKEDYVWMFGQEPYDLTIPERAADSTKGATNFDFNFDPVRIYYDSIRLWDMDGGNTSICDKNGKLLAYSNGQVIINANNMAIEDTINYGSDVSNAVCIEWEYNNYGTNILAIPGGLLGHERVTIIPVGNKFYAIYNTYDYCKEEVYKLSYASFKYELFVTLT